jgi:predicted PhzF superfamily epimerase YddE/YHI9
MPYNFWIVDICNKIEFEGTPAAVFLLDEFLDDSLMQNLAMEINAPETIFVKELSNGDFESICFCPISKGMNFGNALFAAGKIIQQDMHISKKEVNIIHNSEVFPITFLKDERIKIRFHTVKVNKTRVPAGLNDAIQGELIVSIAEAENDLIIELRGPSKLLNINPNFDILKTIDYSSVILTADTHYDTASGYDFCSKVYAPKFGIFFSITTPIAFTKLAAYWSQRMIKQNLIGRQISTSRGGHAEINLIDDSIDIITECVITTKGEIFY